MWNRVFFVAYLRSTSCSTSTCEVFCKLNNDQMSFPCRWVISIQKIPRKCLFEGQWTPQGPEAGKGDLGKSSKAGKQFHPHHDLIFSTCSGKILSFAGIAMHSTVNLLVQGGDYENLRSMSPSECPLPAEVSEETWQRETGLPQWGRDRNLGKQGSFSSTAYRTTCFIFIINE